MVLKKQQKCVGKNITANYLIHETKLRQCTIQYYYFSYRWNYIMDKETLIDYIIGISIALTVISFIF